MMVAGHLREQNGYFQMILSWKGADGKRKSKSISTLIVGMPQSEDGSEHEMQRRIRHFISLVEFDGEVVYVDESFTSAEAQERLMALGKKERSEKIKNGELDSLSAMIILERFLQSQKER